MRRVAITGMGVVSCLGNSVEDVLESLKEGRAVAEVVPEREEMRFNGVVACLVKDFVPPKVDKEQKRSLGNAVKYCLGATKEAIKNSGLDDEQVQDERTVTIMGHCGLHHEVFAECDLKVNKGKKLGSMVLPKSMTSSPTANLGVILGLHGPTYTVAAACASSAVSVGQALLAIRHGLQDRAIVGGLHDGCWEFDSHFDALRVLSERSDDPGAASRPFDIDRDGLVPSSGAATVILEEYEMAKARGAHIIAELVGYSLNNDGYKMTSPSGIGAIKCMNAALEDGQIAPEQIDYINAHGTSTPVGDAREAQGIEQIFGKKPLVSSTKSMTGHEVGSASANELVYSLLMMEHQFVAPSINIDNLDDQCKGINIVANEAIDAKIDVALSNSFGFGGVNACLVFKRPD